MDTSEQIELHALVHREDGMYWAEVPSHPGLYASGETMDELVEAIGEAWLLYSNGDQRAGESVRHPAAEVATRSLCVLVPA